MTAIDRENVFMFAVKRTLVDCSVLFKFYSANVKKLKIVFFRDIISFNLAWEFWDKWYTTYLECRGVKTAADYVGWYIHISNFVSSRFARTSTIIISIRCYSAVLVFATTDIFATLVANIRCNVQWWAYCSYVSMWIKIVHRKLLQNDMYCCQSTNADD